jgi:hypothetical protein
MIDIGGLYIGPRSISPVAMSNVKTRLCAVTIVKELFSWSNARSSDLSQNVLASEKFPQVRNKSPLE